MPLLHSEGVWIWKASFIGRRRVFLARWLSFDSPHKTFFLCFWSFIPGWRWHWANSDSESYNVSDCREASEIMFTKLWIEEKRSCMNLKREKKWEVSKITKRRASNHEGSRGECSATAWPVLGHRYVFLPRSRATNRLTWCDGRWMCFCQKLLMGLCCRAGCMHIRRHDDGETRDAAAAAAAGLSDKSALDAGARPWRPVCRAPHSFLSFENCQQQPTRHEGRKRDASWGGKSGAAAMTE